VALSSERVTFASGRVTIWVDVALRHPSYHFWVAYLLLIYIVSQVPLRNVFNHLYITLSTIVVLSAAFSHQGCLLSQHIC